MSAESDEVVKLVLKDLAEAFKRWVANPPDFDRRDKAVNEFVQASFRKHKEGKPLDDAKLAKQTTEAIIPSLLEIKNIYESRAEIINRTNTTFRAQIISLGGTPIE